MHPVLLPQSTVCLHSEYHGLHLMHMQAMLGSAYRCGEDEAVLMLSLVLLCVKPTTWIACAAQILALGEQQQSKLRWAMLQSNNCHVSHVQHAMQAKYGSAAQGIFAAAKRVFAALPLAARIAGD